MHQISVRKVKQILIENELLLVKLGAPWPKWYLNLKDWWRQHLLKVPTIWSLCQPWIMLRISVNWNRICMRCKALSSLLPIHITQWRELPMRKASMWYPAMVTRDSFVWSCLKNPFVHFWPSDAGSFLCFFSFICCFTVDVAKNILFYFCGPAPHNVWNCPKMSHFKSNSQFLLSNKKLTNFSREIKVVNI